MADVNYVITIKHEGYSTPYSENYISSSPSGETNFGAGMSNKNRGANVTSPLSNFTKIGAAIAPVKFAVKMLDLQATIRINRMELRTGNALLQEKISYQYNAIKTLLNPVGGIMWAKQQFNEVQTQQKIYIENAVQSIGLTQARIRAGAIGRRY